MRSIARRFARFTFLAAFLVAVPVAAQDVITVADVTAIGNTVVVPVYVRDVAGTPLGVDRPAGSRIQSLSIRVDYAPMASIQSVTFTRAGITAGLTPTIEFTPSSPGSISLLMTFPESTNPIPFSSNAPAPGDLVARLNVTLASDVAAGTTITLALNSELTQLTDEGGSAATKQTVANGTLALVSGSITVPQPTLSLAPSHQSVITGRTASLTVTMSRALSTATEVTLQSSNPAAVTVQPSVTIPAGSTSTTVTVSAGTEGSAVVSATLPSAAGGASASASLTVTAEPPPSCIQPAAPQLTGPGSALPGDPYSISWSAVAGATEYLVEESAEPTFTGATTRTVSTTTVSYTRTQPGTWYYRARSRNAAGGCDRVSGYSAVISVILTGPPAPELRFLPVVGSTPGAFGAYFKTSVQLYNPRATTISGRIVFHSQGVSGSDTDPSLRYEIAPGATLVFDDLLPALGVATGIGSADVIADSGSPFPVSLVRVFNDAGAAGTTGLAQEKLSPQEALKEGERGALLAPTDLQRLRLNVGVRTLDSGAAMSIVIRSRDGAVLGTVTRNYPQHFFQQVGSAAMLDGFALTGGETLTFEISSGSAFIYGSTTDNTTNDPSVQLVRRID
jgi:uncharacterized protein YjdB